MGEQKIGLREVRALKAGHVIWDAEIGRASCRERVCLAV